MKLTIKYFGMAADASGKSEEQLQLPAAITSRSLKQQLENRYPALKAIELRIAVNQTMVLPDTEIATDAEIGVLPPFAGG